MYVSTRAERALAGGSSFIQSRIHFQARTQEQERGIVQGELQTLPIAFLSPFPAPAAPPKKSRPPRIREPAQH
jgi:hypothetical protein